MSKIEWEDPVGVNHAGTDGLGVVVTARQMRVPSWSGVGTQTILHIDLIVYLEEPIDDPRPAIEAAIATLRKELGL